MMSRSLYKLHIYTIKQLHLTSFFNNSDITTYKAQWLLMVERQIDFVIIQTFLASLIYIDYAVWILSQKIVYSLNVVNVGMSDEHSFYPFAIWHFEAFLSNIYQPAIVRLYVLQHKNVGGVQFARYS